MIFLASLNPRSSSRGRNSPIAADDVEMTGASLADDDDKMAVGGKKTIKYKKVRKSRKKALPHRRKTHRRKTKKPKTTRRKKKN